MVVLCMLKWALPAHALRPTKRDEEYSIIAGHRPSCKNVHPLFVLSQASCETQIARKFIISTHSVSCWSHPQKFESHSQAMASLPWKEPTRCQQHMIFDLLPNFNTTGGRKKTHSPTGHLADQSLPSSLLPPTPLPKRCSAAMLLPAPAPDLCKQCPEWTTLRPKSSPAAPRVDYLY